MNIPLVCFGAGASAAYYSSKQESRRNRSFAYTLRLSALNSTSSRHSEDSLHIGGEKPRYRPGAAIILRAGRGRFVLTFYWIVTRTE